MWQCLSQARCVICFLSSTSSVSSCSLWTWSKCLWPLMHAVSSCTVLWNVLEMQPLQSLAGFAIRRWLLKRWNQEGASERRVDFQFQLDSFERQDGAVGLVARRPTQVVLDEAMRSPEASTMPSWCQSGWPRASLLLPGHCSPPLALVAIGQVTLT